MQDDKWTKDRPAVVTAEGAVFYDGKPLEQATVVLAPLDGKHSASAITDSNGHFTLAAFNSNPGAVPGKYEVMVLKQEPAEETGPPKMDSTGSIIPPPIESVIPTKYSDPKKSGLMAQIPDQGTRDLKFELKD